MTKLRLSSVLLFSFLAFTVACKKDSDSVNIAESTVNFKLDGTAKTYSNCFAMETHEDSTYTLTIQGLSTSDISTKLVLIVGSKTAIASGYHVTTGFFPGTDTPQGILGYLKDSVGYSNINTEETAKQVVDIHITEKTSTNVKGTFSGKAYSSEDETKAFVITEGKFNAKIVHE